MIKRDEPKKETQGGRRDWMREKSKEILVLIPRSQRRVMDDGRMQIPVGSVIRIRRSGKRMTVMREDI